MKNFLLQFFTWWNGQTLGTRFYTWRKGKRVGEDDAGNIYYESKDGRRWVIYNGQIEASAIPDGWHGWIHYRTDVAPSDENYVPREWQKPHKENLTGTPGAYHPPGSLVYAGKRETSSGDYEAWTP